MAENTTQGPSPGMVKPPEALDPLAPKTRQPRLPGAPAPEPPVASGQTVTVDPVQLGVAIAQAQRQAQERERLAVATEGMDRTIPLGAYLVGGKWVNAVGEEIEEPDFEDEESFTKPAPLKKS